MKDEVSIGIRERSDENLKLYLDKSGSDLIRNRFHQTKLQSQVNNDLWL